MLQGRPQIPCDFVLQAIDTVKTVPSLSSGKVVCTPPKWGGDYCTFSSQPSVLFYLLESIPLSCGPGRIICHYARCLFPMIPKGRPVRCGPSSAFDPVSMAQKAQHHHFLLQALHSRLTPVRVNSYLTNYASQVEIVDCTYLYQKTLHIACKE